MKRAFAALLALIMAISLVGCGEKDGQNPNIEANAGSVSPDKEAEKTISGNTEEVWMVISETNTSSSGYETTIEYAYNPDGSYSMDSSQDGYFEFDANGNEVLFKNYFIVRTTTYDKNGNKIAEETESSEGSKEKHEYKYDDQGNCIEELFYKNDGSVSTQILREYDSNGNMTWEEHIGEDFSYAEAYIYDEHNNVISTKDYENGELKKEIVQEYSYDEAGNMLTRKYPRYGGYHIQKFVYNEQGLLISEKKGTELCDDCDKNAVYEYDENGNLIYEKFMNDTELIRIEKYYQYDENGNLIYEKWTYENSFMEEDRYKIEEWVYTYDEHGNKIQLDHSHNYNNGEFSECTVWEYELISFSR